LFCLDYSVYLASGYSVASCGNGDRAGVANSRAFISYNLRGGSVSSFDIPVLGNCLGQEF